MAISDGLSLIRGCLEYGACSSLTEKVLRGFRIYDVPWKELGL